jgi:hypothetical protein
LLTPPSDRRDDELPFIYLGSRLGIEPGEVPRPLTPVVGGRGPRLFRSHRQPAREAEAGRIVAMRCLWHDGRRRSKACPPDLS